MNNVIKINDINIKYAKLGSGTKTFVMLPGVFLTSVVENSESVKVQYERFLDEYTIYLFDYKFVQKDFTIKTFANYFYQIFKELNLDNIYLFGVSMGGCIAQQLLIDHSELFKKTILASTFAKPTQRFVEVVNNWMDLANKYKIEELNIDFYNKCFTKEYLQQYKEILPSLYKQGTASDCDEFVICLKTMLDFDVYEKLQQINNRVLVINSKQDEILGADAGNIISQQLNCDFYLYEKYNHAVYDEALDYKDRIYNFFK